MVGGRRDVLDQVRPAIDAMAGGEFHMGDLGIGSGGQDSRRHDGRRQPRIDMRWRSIGREARPGRANFWELASSPSGDSWPLRICYPIAEVTDPAASNRDFRPGFTAELLAKDSGIAIWRRGVKLTCSLIRFRTPLEAPTLRTSTCYLFGLLGFERLDGARSEQADGLRLFRGASLLRNLNPGHFRGIGLKRRYDLALEGAGLSVQSRCAATTFRRSRLGDLNPGPTHYERTPASLLR